MPTDREYNSCTRKAKYSEKMAEETAFRTRRATGEMIVAYKCPHCEFSHIGHPSYDSRPNRGKK